MRLVLDSLFGKRTFMAYVHITTLGLHSALLFRIKDKLTKTNMLTMCQCGYPRRIHPYKVAIINGLSRATGHHCTFSMTANGSKNEP